MKGFTQEELAEMAVADAEIEDEAKKHQYEIHRRWRERNREKLREKSREYYWKNREAIRKKVNEKRKIERIKKSEKSIT